MQRKHIITLCILLCALAVVVAFRPAADETVPLTGSASAGLILLDGQSEGFYVLAVIDQSRADRSGIKAGDTLLTLNGQTPADLTALDTFFSAQQQPCVITLQRKGKTVDISLPAP